MRKDERQAVARPNRPAVARCGALLALATALALAAPASAAASVQIVGDPLSADTALVDAATWAEVAGQITFSRARQGDTIVSLTAPPQHPCPPEPPAGVQANPGPGANAESLPVLADGEGEDFVLTPSRRQVAGKATRLCAYLMRNGALQARGSSRLAVALAPSSGRPAPSSPSGRTGRSKNLGSSVLALILLALAAIGVITTVRKLRRRRRRSSGRPTAPARNRQPSALPAPGASPATTGNGHASAPQAATLPAVTERPAPSAEKDVVRVLAHVRFSQHAIEQFATRAGVPLTSYGHVELLIRELLRREGKVTTERPFWSRSSNIADLYLQAGEWMLFILLRDRWLPWRYTCVTAVNGPQENSWENALRRGYIRTPPGTPGLN
jgi:hypothetical protein